MGATPAPDMPRSSSPQCVASLKTRRGVRLPTVVSYGPASAAFTFATAATKAARRPVANPVHVLFYRVIQPGLVEIVRVLHDHMEPSRHIAGAGDD